MKTMTKKQMAEEILQSSSAMGVSERRFYNNVNRQTKGWIKHLYDDVMNAPNESEKKLNADYAMNWLR